MKRLLITFFLFSICCHAQKQYEFDYLIEYQLTNYKDSLVGKNDRVRKLNKTTTRYYLTNSKNNTFVAIVTSLDSFNYKMIFKDENGIYANVTFLKSDLDKAEFINIQCKHVIPYRNLFKHQIKNYDYKILADTLLDNKPYSRYLLSSTKRRRTKRKKLGSELYIIDKKTKFHLPILTRSTAYEEWKSNKNLPYGIFQERHFINFYGKLTLKEQLINLLKIDKKIIIQDTCDYTNPEVKTNNLDHKH